MLIEELGHTKVIEGSHEYFSLRKYGSVHKINLWRIYKSIEICEDIFQKRNNRISFLSLHTEG